MHGKSDRVTSDRPNIIARTVARLSISIRSKLLVAFLGGTALMVGLALFGLIALQQANERTVKLLHDQDRIAFYNELYGYLSDLIAFAASAQIDPADVQADKVSDIFLEAGGNMTSRTNFAQRFVGQGVRKFGRAGMPDENIIANIRAELKKLTPIVSHVNKLRNEAAYGPAGIVSRQQFAPIVLTLQRDTFTVVQQIEAEMAETAKSTALAYNTSRRQVIASAFVAVGLALLLGYAISSSLIWPVRRIGQTLGVIAGGDFDARVTVPNRDELGELATNVNVTSERLGTLYNEVEGQRAELAEWNTALEDKVATQVDQIERTNRLRRFLPTQVADLIVGAPDGQDMLGSRRGEVTVLFADLRGFTAYSNAVPPEQVIEALNAFHAASGPLIEAKGGTLERFLGDGLMVLFGAPLPLENAAESAVALARDMQAAFRPALEPFQTPDNALGLGNGIATGIATLGQIGFEGRLDYSAIGPAPNLAARLCDHAGDGQILLCEATAHGIDVSVTPAGPFRLKGIGDDVAAFEVRHTTKGN
ncbi:MAG: adenylate/guanylate cyclase domain-containing protein [Boseongicola sp.]